MVFRRFGIRLTVILVVNGIRLKTPGQIPVLAIRLCTGRAWQQYQQSQHLKTFPSHVIAFINE